jgi:Kef-type K+ transport system membrane component KefB
MASGTLTSVVMIALAAALAPLVADQLSRWLPVPATILEIAFGILIGPAVLGLAHTDEVVEAVAAFGLAILFFLAGYEIRFDRIRGEPLRRALGSWVGSLAVGLVVGGLLAALLGGGVRAALAVGLALASTALGTILPILRDAGVLRTRLGAMVMAVGAVGEFAPIVMIALLLSGERPLHATALLITFTAAAVGAAILAMRPPRPWLTRLLTVTLGTSAQFAVRVSVLVVLAMVWLATELHLDLVLGAFAAGVVMRLVLASISRREAMVVESKIEGIGFGMVIPFFFVTTGLRVDLAALWDRPAALALVPLGLVALLLVRGAPVVLVFRRRLPRPDLLRLGLYGSTALPLVVVITQLGVTNGWLTSATAAGLVGAAMLSVLVFPLAARPSRPAPPPERPEAPLPEAPRPGTAAAPPGSVENPDDHHEEGSRAPGDRSVHRGLVGEGGRPGGDGAG